MSKKVLSDQQIDTLLKGVMDRVKITKVVATRSVKTRNGDTFVGFSAAFDSVQDDSMQGIDGAEISEGMNLKDADLASLVLGLHADMAAHRNALAGGTISSEFFQGQTRAIKRNYAMLIQQMLGEGSDEEA